MEFSPSEVLDGKYRIVRLLGRGGMGAVYLGEHINIHRQVAIKVLSADAGRVSDAIQRFEREAQAAGRIGSDHIVEVYDIGTTNTGERFMVMEYLEGESLRARLGRGAIVDPLAILPILIQLLEGLSAAHAAGIIHRDLKPDNVFVSKSKAGRKDFVKILDFGISKFSNLGGDGTTTRTGVVLGSPNYMSPEQVQSSNEVDVRSDLYSVGVILYESATGRVPFKGGTFTELLFKIVYETLPDPRSLNPAIDAELSSILMKACARNGDDRFQSADEFRTALESYLAGLVTSRGDRRHVVPPPPVASNPGSRASDASLPTQAIALPLPTEAPVPTAVLDPTPPPRPPPIPASDYEDRTLAWNGSGSGDHASGNHASGNHASGNHASGNHASGNHASGNHASGNHASGNYAGALPGLAPPPSSSAFTAPFPPGSGIPVMTPTSLDGSLHNNTAYGASVTGGFGKPASSGKTAAVVFALCAIVAIGGGAAWWFTQANTVASAPAAPVAPPTPAPVPTPATSVASEPTSDAVVLDGDTAATPTASADTTATDVASANASARLPPRTPAGLRPTIKPIPKTQPSVDLGY